MENLNAIHTVRNLIQALEIKGSDAPIIAQLLGVLVILENQVRAKEFANEIQDDCV